MFFSDSSTSLTQTHSLMEKSLIAARSYIRHSRLQIMFTVAHNK